MHAAGMWTAFSAILSGLTVVLYDTRARFDPRAVWETAERERVGMMTMVGDAYAGPLVDELQRRRYDLSSLSPPSAPAGLRRTRSTSARCWNYCPSSP